jgi:hypothetical protein
MKTYVILTLNNRPIGLYANADKADEAAHVDWRYREPRWEELDFGQTWSTGLGNYARWHYIKIELELNEGIEYEDS